MPKKRKVVAKRIVTDAGKWLSKEKQRIKVPRVPDVKCTPRKVLRNNNVSDRGGTSIKNFFQRPRGRVPPSITNDAFDKENEKPAMKNSQEIQCGFVHYPKTCTVPSIKPATPTGVGHLVRTHNIPFKEHCSALDSVPACIDKDEKHSRDVWLRPASHTSNPSRSGNAATSETQQVGFEANSRHEHLLQAPPRNDIDEPSPYLELSLDFAHFSPVATSTQVLPGSDPYETGASAWQTAHSQLAYPDSPPGSSNDLRQTQPTSSEHQHHCSNYTEFEKENMSIASPEYELSMRFTQDSQGNLIFCRLSPKKQNHDEGKFY